MGERDCSIAAHNLAKGVAVALQLLSATNKQGLLAVFVIAAPCHGGGWEWHNPLRSLLSCRYIRNRSRSSYSFRQCNAYVRASVERARDMMLVMSSRGW